MEQRAWRWLCGSVSVRLRDERWEPAPPMVGARWR